MGHLNYAQLSTCPLCGTMKNQARLVCPHCAPGLNLLLNAEEVPPAPLGLEMDGAKGFIPAIVSACGLCMLTLGLLLANYSLAPSSHLTETNARSRPLVRTSQPPHLSTMTGFSNASLSAKRPGPASQNR